MEKKTCDILSKLFGQMYEEDSQFQITELQAIMEEQKINQTEKGTYSKNKNETLYINNEQMYDEKQNVAFKYTEAEDLIKNSMYQSIFSMENLEQKFIYRSKDNMNINHVVVIQKYQNNKHQWQDSDQDVLQENEYYRILDFSIALKFLEQEWENLTIYLEFMEYKEKFIENKNLQQGQQQVGFKDFEEEIYQENQQNFLEQNLFNYNQDQEDKCPIIDFSNFQNECNKQKFEFEQDQYQQILNYEDDNMFNDSLNNYQPQNIEAYNKQCNQELEQPNINKYEISQKNNIKLQKNINNIF
ncbi:hypothetical protein PPERSA_07754 [Pseudocohnilembus persalinus]|uniref:Uncharacterized protein n=1 Tax=Pseudocohnilembus persalinus TaxID=266149 RepID=A0A0V0R9Q0_PSEPJ|nr:hypothetical protein PPERSA_07754 [Pseudocohnilembus persalinus]|eukprot:KRX11229.1 hypothetical protein PPERSA_07754 [Pseudocohnilembus persalinus]